MKRVFPLAVLRKSTRKRARLMKLIRSSFFLQVLIICVFHTGVLSKAVAPRREPAVSTAHTPQNGNKAETYRKLAAAKRRAAENVPAKRDCYLLWARYYDCLADKLEAGDNRDCGKEPDEC